MKPLIPILCLFTGPAIAFGASSPVSITLGPVFPIIGPKTQPALAINPNPGVRGYSAYDAFLFFFENAGGGTTTLVTFGQHLDQVIWPTRDGMVISRDRGATWPVYLQHAAAAAGFFISAMVQIRQPAGLLPAGALLAMSYTMQQDQSDPAHRREFCYYWTSPDDGRDWAPHRGTGALPAAQFYRPGTTNAYRTTASSAPTTAGQGCSFTAASDSCPTALSRGRCTAIIRSTMTADPAWPPLIIAGSSGSNHPAPRFVTPSRWYLIPTSVKEDWAREMKGQEARNTKRISLNGLTNRLGR